MKIVIRILSAVAGTLALLFVGAFLYYFLLTSSVRLDGKERLAAGNKIALYDRNDRLVYRCTDAGDGGIEYEELNRYTIDAFLCAEDRKFFRHNGLDYKRMAAAFWKNATSFSFKEGASTISQQLVKNTMLSPEKTIDRKLKEIKLTRELEQKYSKQEILAAYLNSIYFGHGCFGISEASAFYFGKKTEELSLAESATLAALVCSPNNYSPFRQAENCLKRRNRLLNTMKNEGKITAAECEESKQEALPTIRHERDDGTASYVSALLEELESVYPDEIYRLKIYTYLDKDLQNELKAQSYESDTDKSFCVIDMKNGGIKAFYSTVGKIERAPASVIKPLLVYAPALEEDVISPATPILDEKINFDGYSPRNFDNRYHGYVSCREALSKSYNVPAVRIFNSLPAEKGIEYLEKMDLPVAKKDRHLALALGATEKGYSLPALCGAYTSFSDGNYRGYGMIKRVTDENGRELYRRKEEKRAIFSQDTVVLLNDMLRETVLSGTAKKMKKLPYEVCAKTGTNGNEKGNIDAYCISYTSEDVVGVWTGNADRTLMQTITGGGLPTNVAMNILNYLYADRTPAPFPRSNDVVECLLDRREYENNHRLLLCDENAPVQERTIKYLFKRKNAPREVSTYFSKPKSGNYSVFSLDNAICIELCLTEYQYILVNRRDKNGFKTVYQGKSVEKVIDDDVIDGGEYYYSVTPYYQEFVGETTELPAVVFRKKSAGTISDGQ